MSSWDFDCQTSRLVKVQGFTRVRSETASRTSAAVIVEHYLVYCRQGIYIYEKKANESQPFKLKQFIDAVPFNDNGFGGSMVMSNDDRVLLACGDHHIFFFAINNGTIAEGEWELVTCTSM